MVFLYGQWRLRSNPPAQSIKVTLIAKDVPISVYLGPEEQTLELLHAYADEVRRATPAGTQVVVLPEKIGRVSEGSLPQVDALFSSAAAATHSAIVLGLVRQTPSAAFNSSRFYSAAGKLEANYDKHHLLPGIEPEKPGDKRVVLDQPSGRWGLQICKDMDFPRLSREYAGEGASLLLVPAWDFNLDRWLHARMAVLRAVENGFALARSARNGLLTLSDSRGRILAELPTAPGRFVSITGTVSVPREKTIYTQTGDWFAWICIAIFFALLVSRFLPRYDRVIMINHGSHGFNGLGLELCRASASLANPIKRRQAARPPYKTKAKTAAKISSAAAVVRIPYWEEFRGFDSDHHQPCVVAPVARTG